MALGGGNSSGGSGSASPNAIKAGEAFVELSANDKALQKTLMGVVNKIKRAGVMIRQVGLGATAAGLAILAPLAGATRVFADFDDKMRMVKAVTQGSAEDFERLGNLAKRLGQSTSFTASQVAGLMTELGKGGFNVKQIETITESVLNLARASGTDATLSAEIFVSTMNQFGLKAEDATRIVDTLANTANKSAISVADLGESFSYAATDISNLGLSIEDAAALVGVLGNLGIKGSSAGTAIRRLGLILASQPTKIKDYFNVDTKDATGNLRPVVDILDEIFQVTKDMGTADKAKAMADVFGILTITSASGLAKSSAGIRQFADELRNMPGVAARTAKEMDEGIGGSLRRLRGGIEGVVLAIGDALAPVLIEIQGYITPIVRVFIDWIKANKEIVVTVLALGAGLVAVGTALATFGFMITGIIAGISTLGTIIGAVFSPFVITLVAVSALLAEIVIAATVLAKTFDSIGPTFESIGETFSQMWGGILAALKAGDLQKATDILIIGMRLAFEQLGLLVVRTWAGLKLTFVETFNDIIYLLKDLWTSFVTWVENTFYEALAGIVKQFIALAESIGMPLKLEEGDINRIRNEAIAENEKRRLKEMRETDEYLRRVKEGVKALGEEEINAQQRIVDLMKTVLGRLLQQADKPGLEQAPMPREVNRIAEQAKIDNNLAMLADSVRSTFSSGNYAGVFGKGGKNELEKQTGLLKSIDKKLDKLDVPVWE